MARINFTQAQAFREITAFNRRLARSTGAMRELADVRIGATPRVALMQIDGVTLYRYECPPTATAKIPILIVYALVNRPEVADLQQGRSMIADLIERGFDVYLIDWGYPRATDANLGLDDYIMRYLDGCVDYLRQRLKHERLNLLGICQGGTFSVCYAALYPDKVACLITTVTPVDFHTDGDMLSHLVRHIDFEALADSQGNLGGEALNALFLSLKPYRLLQQKYLRFAEHLDDRDACETFMRMEQWIFDSPNLAARACREFASWLYQENRLVKGTLEISGRPVELQRLTVPVLNIYARDDHLVPPQAARALGNLIGSEDYTERELLGGHIGIYVTMRAANSVPALIEDWLLERV